jgi:hypothetical protein
MQQSQRYRGLENRRKSNQIVNDHAYLPILLVFYFIVNKKTYLIGVILENETGPAAEFLSALLTYLYNTLIKTRLITFGSKISLNKSSYKMITDCMHYLSWYNLEKQRQK